MSKTEQISSRDNSRIKQIAKLQASAKERRESGLFVLEGIRLCTDLIRSNLAPQQMFLTQQALDKYADMLAPLTDAADSVFLVEQSLFSKIADTDSPQGVICVVKKPTDTPVLLKEGKYVFLCNVSDPANLGAISRTAEALGLDGMLLSGGCDVYHPKALRASMGALLRLPVLQEETETVLDLLKQIGIKTFASTPQIDARPIGECDFSGGCCMLIGNEANGLDKSLIDACDTAVTIPMAGRAESLNAGAAAAILMYEMVRP